MAINVKFGFDKARAELHLDPHFTPFNAIVTVTSIRPSLSEPSTTIMTLGPNNLGGPYTVPFGKNRSFMKSWGAHAPEGHCEFITIAIPYSAMEVLYNAASQINGILDLSLEGLDRLDKKYNLTSGRFKGWPTDYMLKNDNSFELD